MEIKKEIINVCYKIHCGCNNYRDCNADRIIYRNAIARILRDCDIEKFNISITFDYSGDGKGKYRIAVAWYSKYEDVELLVI